MLIVIACILLAAAIGGGIYVWVKRARKNLLAKKTKLAESSKLQEEGKPSILDSVVSPVTQDSTSSTASDHPQINAPTDPANGAVVNGTGSQADGLSAAQPAAPPSQAKYIARFRHAAPAIKDLAEKLLVAWNQASETLRLETESWNEVYRVRNTIFCGNDCRFIDSPAQSAEFMGNLNQHFGSELRQYKKWLALAAQLGPDCQAASQAFEALRQALRPFSLDDSELLPPDLQVICNSAHQVLNTSRDSIEKQLKTAVEKAKGMEKEEVEGKPVKHDRAGVLHDANDDSFAEGTEEDDRQDTLEARATLIRAAIEAIDKHFPCDKAEETAGKVFTDLEELEQQSFTFPKKPTPEEIVRFLNEVEVWRKQKLALERQVEPALAELDSCIKALKEEVGSLKRMRGRTTPVLSDTKRTIDDGLTMAASKVVTDLEALLTNLTAELAKMREKKPKVTEPQPKVTSQEEAAINTLRASMRTLAFALAQRAVANTKLAQIQQQEPPVNGFAPRVERSQNFQKYLERYEAFHTERGKQTVTHDQWEQTRDTVQMAYGARSQKVTESSQGLGAKLGEVLKTSIADPADELLVVSGMADKLVQLTSK